MLPSAGWPPAGWPPSAGWPRQSARAVGHIPARGRIFSVRRVGPFRRVAQAAKQIVKARKPQSCALFSSRKQPFCSSCPAFYLRCPGLSSHSTFYLPKGSLSPSLFCFSVPNVQYYVTKAHYYHSQANIPGTRAQKPRFCARNARKRGFRTPKAHKNLDFVLENPKNEGSIR